MKIEAVISLFLPYGLMGICTSGTSEPGYRKFGVQTSYFENADLDTSPVSVPGCEPAYFWFLARHGARRPNAEEIQNMETYLPGLRDRIVTAWSAGNGQLEAETVEMFEDWSLGITIEDEMMLTESGKREHEEMGSRWGKRLNGLLNATDSVLIRASKTERTRESAQYFSKGVFKTDVEVPPSPEVEDDLLLRFMSNCPKWQQGVWHNPDSYSERDDLERSQDYKLMLKEVGDLVGVELTPFEVALSWDMCRFETAWSPDGTTPWCHIFTEGNLRLMEFREDLAYYYTTGYGNDVNLNMTQPVFEDILQKFEEIEEGKGEYKAALHFAHETTVLPVLAALGLHHDEQDLQSSDWPESQDYQWRTSLLASFAANVGLVLLECDSEAENRWKVMAMAQERPLMLPACGQEVCTLQQFMRFYSHWTNLDFQSFCKFNLKWNDLN